MNMLLKNISKAHSTPLGIQRIKKNLNLDSDDVLEYCINLIEDKNSKIRKEGKNYYVTRENEELTIHSTSFTIITAHKID